MSWQHGRGRAPQEQRILHDADKPLCHLVITPKMIKGTSVLRESNKFREPRVFLSHNGGSPDCISYHCFSLDDTVRYDPFCDDFGPMSALSIIRFVKLLDRQINNSASTIPHQHNVVFCAGGGPRNLTNAAFLLGAYMILKLNQTTADVLTRFCDLDSRLFESFRDATHVKPTFGLHLADCWYGLARGKEQSWIALPVADSPPVWGQIDEDSYSHYDNPMNADLHEVVPERIIVFRGPKDLMGVEFRNNFSGGTFASRDFSPEYFLDIFKDLGVVAVIRLNDRQYDEAVFESHGIRHYDLPFSDDYSTPPPALVSSFFKIMDANMGRVAIHGRTSLGRAGTLVALYLMRTYRFSAREAIAWMRIMRPGSVIGSQQHYLTTIDSCVQSLIASSSGAPRSPDAGAAASFATAAEAAGSYQERSWDDRRFERRPPQRSLSTNSPADYAIGSAASASSGRVASTRDTDAAHSTMTRSSSAHRIAAGEEDENKRARWRLSSSASCNKLV